MNVSDQMSIIYQLCLLNSLHSSNAIYQIASLLCKELIKGYRICSFKEPQHCITLEHQNDFEIWYNNTFLKKSFFLFTWFHHGNYIGRISIIGFPNKICAWEDLPCVCLGGITLESVAPFSVWIPASKNVNAILKAKRS